MEKRYLVKWYALAAVIVVFLVIWISQQNAASNTVCCTLDPSKWLQDGGSHQALQHGRNHSGLPSRGLEYRILSTNVTNSSGTSVDLHTLPDTGHDAVLRETWSGNSYPGDSNEDLHLTVVGDKEALADTKDMMSDIVVFGEINPNR